MVFGKSNGRLVQKLHRPIHKFKPIVRLEGLSLSIQNIIMWISFIIYTQARDDGGFIVQKSNTPIYK